MPLSGMLTCGSCGTRTQMGTMRYNLSGNKLICPDCVDKERSSIKPGTTHATSVRLREQARVAEGMRMRSSSLAAGASGAEPQMAQNGPHSGEGGEGDVNYYCRSCHFKFTRKRDAEVASCPYCGRDSISVAYEGKAQDLIEEATARAEEQLF